MIIEAILKVIGGIIRGFVGLFGSLAPPAWLTGLTGPLEQLMGEVASVGAWIPWSTVAMVAATVLTCMALGFTIKIVRIIASFFTAGGGSAA